MTGSIDVVVPVAVKDLPKLDTCIKNLIDNSQTPIRNIYIVTKKEVFQNNTSFVTQPVIWIDEASYPFNLNDIKELAQKNKYKNNTSWYYQQLLKFYIFEVIPDLQTQTLILDVDFFIGKKIDFITDDGKAILPYGYPFKWLLNTRQYPSKNSHSHIEFAERLIPNWRTINHFSGMHHHMLFHRDIIQNLFSTVQTYHQQNFWRAFIKNLEFKKWNAASEYVIYYHFAMAYYPNLVVSRHLKSCDFIHDEKENKFVLNKAQNVLSKREFQVVGCHSFLDLRERLNTMDYIPTDLRNQILTSERLVFKLTLDDGLLAIELV